MNTCRTSHSRAIAGLLEQQVSERSTLTFKLSDSLTCLIGFGQCQTTLFKSGRTTTICNPNTNVEGDVVRPCMVAAFALLKLEHISNDEFTYLLPLCTNRENTERIIKEITNLRNGKGSIDEIILTRLMSMENYRQPPKT